MTGYRLPVTEHLRGVRQIVISRKSELPSEGYTLDVTIPQIRIEGRDYAGAFTRFKRFSSCCPPQCTTRPPRSGRDVEIELSDRRLAALPVPGCHA
ncbi:MAG: hypothetical protein ACLR76_10460 [Alistipes sp.]